MRKIRKTPVLADSYQIPRYKYTEKDEEYYDTPDEYGMKKADYSPVYRTKTNTIEVPKRSWSKNDVHLVIKDTNGHEILKDGWYPKNFVDEISRWLPHWGFKDVQRTTGDPNVWIVEKDRDEYITVNRKPVKSSLDLFGIDDAFFTREELNELADAVETDVNEKFKSFNSDFSIDYTGIWLEDDNRTITMDYICFPNETEYSISVRIDMRKIQVPGDIFKYVETFANKIDSQIQSSEVIGSTNIQAGDDYVGNLLPFGDEDGYYLVTAYSDDNFRGVMDDFTSNSFDDIILKANEYCNNGFNVEIENIGSGEGKRYSYSEWLECIEQTGEPPYSVFNLSDGNIEASTSITSSSNIDELEKIAHNVFNDVMPGYKKNQGINDDIIADAADNYDPNLSSDDMNKVIDLVNENIESYLNFGSFGQIQAQKYGDMILKAYDGQIISKRRDTANQPGGITYCANAIGLGTFQLLEALEGMCADGRAYEFSDSTYHVGK